MSPPLPPKIKILISIDFDAVSGWLGTGSHPSNTLSDYSAGMFAARVGVPRLLRLFKKLGIEGRVTWFVPGHSVESFPGEFGAIVRSGAEVGGHGYCHEGAYQLTEAQEREVLDKCIELITQHTGKRPRGYRAPLYQLRESTVKLLEEKGFLYDSSLSHHDSQPYFLTLPPAIKPPVYDPSVSAATWMHPLPPPAPRTESTLVEIPGNWYAEDMTPLQFWPHTPNSQGYVDARVVERMWMDRFEWIRGEMLERWRERVEKAEEEGDEEGRDVDCVVFPLILHPDTSGMAHVIGMVERMLVWLKGWGDEVEFCTFGECAERWKAAQ